MNVYFKNSSGKELLIGTVKDSDEAYKKIEEFCAERNFKIRYIRCWGDPYENGQFYDVGSWSEKFILKA